MKLKSNVSIKLGTFYETRTSKSFWAVIDKDPLYSHNVVVDIGKSFIIKMMYGGYSLSGTSVSPRIDYYGVGRAEFPGGGSPVDADKSNESLTDVNPYYIPIQSRSLRLSEDSKYPKAIEFNIYLLGTPEIFSHFDTTDNVLSIGEHGLFFGSTDPDPDWGKDTAGNKIPYTMFARDYIIGAQGAPLELKRSDQPGTYYGYQISWLVAME